MGSEQLISAIFALAFLCVVSSSSISRGDALGRQGAKVQSFPFNASFLNTSVYLAYVAFCPNTSILTWTCEWCGHRPGFVGAAYLWNVTTDVHGYVAYSPAEETIVIGFRGTIGPWETIFIDLWPGKQDPYPSQPGAMVHSGFLNQYTSVQGLILSTVDSILSRSDVNISRILCTGHSLGAAVAGICAVDMSERYGSRVSRVSVVNYGSPRIGNSVFAAYYQSLGIESWRVVHYHDIVPHWPIEQIPFEYRHVTTEVWETNETDASQLKVCDSENGEDPTCADSVPVTEYKPSDHMTYCGIYNSPCGY